QAGAIAGMTVDLTLYPLDTLKTRLQAREGFRHAGGFRGVYRGILPVLVGSAPNAAIFFLAYERAKQQLGPASGAQHAALVHMAAASIAETAACIIRVPVEVVKQRAQIYRARGGARGVLDVASVLMRRDGWRGFYRGFGTTVMREIPFTCIQFPLYEYLKHVWSVQQDTPVQPWQASLCGSVAGGCAAAVTTPLDVLKTRMMLSDETVQRLSPAKLARQIVREEGAHVLLRGLAPRVLWISAGGAIFLGAYEKASKELRRRDGP
ncbi:mitochondrial carrier domain-containing protein, partial [Thamnocephalis sphaerospora]